MLLAEEFVLAVSAVQSTSPPTPVTSEASQ
jgi:hypothetical protein